nr:MAG TPA: hypothetical protein [Caudoviricetes sp.]
MDLIDRASLDFSFDRRCFSEGDEQYVRGADDAIGVVINAPAIDAVPVVRCAQCKHLNIVNDPKLYAYCPKTNTVFLPFELDTRIHFCSLGHRKKAAHD